MNEQQADGNERSGIPWRKILIGDFTWKRLLKSVVFIYGTLVVIGLFFSDWLIFPYRSSSYDAALPGLELIEGGGGQRLAVRHWRAENEVALILLFHGNAEDIGQFDGIAHEMGRFGFSLLTMDYRGYGLSEGKPTEAGCYADAEKVYDLVLAKGYPAEKVLIWGRSVGAGTAIELALRRKVKGLVLESAFVTAFRAATRVPILPFDKFDNLSKIPAVEAPLFVIHGTEDRVIPYWHGKRLYAAYEGKKQFVRMTGAGHNDLWLHDTNGMLQAVREFFFPKVD